MPIGPRHIHYSDMHIHDNTTATVINNGDSPHLIQGLFILEHAIGFTFESGSTGAITDTANNGGILRITDTDHGLSTGDIVSTTGLSTAAQNNVTKVTVIDSATFDCDDITFVTASETGIWYQGDRLIAAAGSGGTYKIDFHSYGTSAGTNKTFEYGIFINEIEETITHSKRKYATVDVGVVGASGITFIDDGDEVTFYIKGQDSTNFTLDHCNVILHEVL